MAHAVFKCANVGVGASLAGLPVLNMQQPTGHDSDRGEFNCQTAVADRDECKLVKGCVRSPRNGTEISKAEASSREPLCPAVAMLAGLSADGKVR
jgi:hypothetical protein